MSEEKCAGHHALTCWGICGILELLDVESLHSHRLALVPGPVDDGAAAPLAQDAALTLRVFQPAVLQEEPAGHTAQGLASDLGQGVAWAQLMLSHPGEQIKVTCVPALDPPHGRWSAWAAIQSCQTSVSASVWRTHPRDPWRGAEKPGLGEFSDYSGHRLRIPLYTLCFESCHP